jgi:O-antigen/teichoic acid export membrane protein
LNSSAIPKPSLGGPDSSAVAKKALRGIVALGGRQFFVHGLNISGNILLARLLSPKDFGIYAIVMFLIQFLGSFGGTGLACNLIRSTVEPEEADYASVFMFQQLSLLLLVAALWFISPEIANFYGLTHQYVWLFQFTALSLLITSFMVIPQVRLERELAFSKLAVVEVWQALMFNAVAILLAWRSWGGMAFAAALLVRSLTGVLVVYIVSPWKVHWRWDWPRAKLHLSFGFFYQSSQVISLAKDSVTPLLVGFLVGPASVGYVSWAGMLASYPVLVLLILQRIYVPVFARIQHDRRQLGQFVEKTIWATNAFAAPIAIITLVLAHPITVLIFGDKWLIAVPMFYLFWVTNLFVPTATPLLGLLNALGRSRMALMFTILWMVLNWALGAPLVMRMGAIGLAWASVGVQVSNLALYAVAKKELSFRILPFIAPSWIFAAIVGAGLWSLQLVRPVQSLPVLVAYGALGMAVYLSAVAWRHRSDFRNLWVLASHSG